MKIEEALEWEGTHKVLSHTASETKLVVDTLTTEVRRLNNALQWEQNRSRHVGTHAYGCHTWGPAHYECLLRKFEAAEAALAECQRKAETLDRLFELIPSLLELAAIEAAKEEG